MKKTAYIDNNIIVDFEQNKISRTDLLQNIDNNISKFYYSAAHLQEANEMKGDNLTNLLLRRFQSISDLTKNNYILHKLPSNKINKYKEEPSIVYETITFVSSAQNMMKGMANFVTEEQKEKYRKEIGFNPIRINNYNPKEIISHLNNKMKVWEGMSLLGVLDYCISMFPEGYGGLHNRISALFELLDTIGYWKDKSNEKSNYARLWDSNHTYYSSFCDYFISDDKRTRNKAKVVFEIYNIKTIVVSSIGK